MRALQNPSDADRKTWATPGVFLFGLGVGVIFLAALSSRPASASASSFTPTYGDFPGLRRSTLQANGIAVSDAEWENIERNAPVVYQAALEFGLDPSWYLGQIYAESRFRDNPTSPAGACGISQFMPGTGVEIANKMYHDGLLSQNSYRCEDVNQMARMGAYLMNRLLESQYTQGNMTLALAGYNAGIGNVKKYGGVPPFSETQNYVTNINTYRQVFAEALL